MAFRVVVTGFIGSGTSLDPFRADVANPDDVTLTTVDLSPDRFAPDRCVTILDYGDGVPSRAATRADGTTGSGFFDLGEDPWLRLSGALRTQLSTRLGVTIPTNATLGAAILLRLGAALQPERDGFLRIRCGRAILHEQPAVSGGATDPFTYSNGALHTVSSGLWVRHTNASPSFAGTMQVTSNTVASDASQDSASRYDSDLGSAGHYAQLEVTISGTASGNDVMAGPITRMGTTTTAVSGFCGLAGAQTNADRFMLVRIDSGSITSLGTTTTSAGTYELRVESNGSSQILFVDDANTLSATDAAHSANTYTGIYSYKYGTYTATGDNFEANVLDIPAVPVTVSSAGSGNSASSTATLAFDCGDTFAVGDIIAVCISADNAGSAGISSLASVADAVGNIYQLLQATYDPGAAAAGQTVGIAWALVTTALAATDDVTISFSPNTTSKAAVVHKLHPDTGITLQLVTSGFTAGSATGTPTVTTATVTIGDVVVAALAAESNATPTQDGDSTNGAWSTQMTAVGNTGTSGTSSRVASQTKIVTATATQTYNPTITSCDNILGWITFTPAFIRWDRVAVRPSQAVHRSRNW